MAALTRGGLEEMSKPIETLFTVACLLTAQFLISTTKNESCTICEFFSLPYVFEQVLLKKFMTALTRGGPDGMPKPINDSMFSYREILDQRHTNKPLDLRFTQLTSETFFLAHLRDMFLSRCS